MSAQLLATRRLIAAVLKGDRPEEALARTALAEVATFSATQVEVAPTEQLAAPHLAVTTDEVLAALVPMFAIMESLVVDLRARVGGKLVVSADMANAYIAAHAVLKKAGHEPVKHRKVNPLTFTAVMKQKA